MNLLSLADLKSKGIKFTRGHIHRLVKAGKFPRPIKIGENCNAWLEPEIDQHIEEKIAERDQAA